MFTSVFMSLIPFAALVRNSSDFVIHDSIEPTGRDAVRFSLKGIFPSFRPVLLFWRGIFGGWPR